MQTKIAQPEKENSPAPKNWRTLISNYFFNLARKSFFRLGKRFVVPDLKGQEQLPNAKIKYFLVENATYKEENAWHREKLLQLARKLSETKKDLKTATRQIVFLSYQMSRFGIIFENLKREIREKELEINLLKEVIANHFVGKAIPPAPTPPQPEDSCLAKEILPKRERLTLKAEEYSLPKIAEGFGGKKTVFSNALLEELFESGLCEKLVEKIIAAIKNLCQNGPTFNRAFNLRPLNGKVRTVPLGASIGNLTNKYRLIFKIEKSGIIAFYKLRRRDDSTYK